MENDAVECAICHKRMSIINNRHLSTHNMTADDYRARFPDHELLSETSKRKLSERSVKANEHRRGKKRTEEEKFAIRTGIATAGPRKAWNKGQKLSREQRDKLSQRHRDDFASGKRVSWQLGKPVSDETRQKISKALTGRKVDPEIARKTVETKRMRGYDMAPMRGKKHSIETRQLIGERTTARFAKERFARRRPMMERIHESNLILLNDITSEVFELQCRSCSTQFTRTPQMFQPSKWHMEICDQCFPISPVSDAENEVANLCETIRPIIRRSDLETIAPLELDIVMDGVAIEYCGLYWHSEMAGKNRFYHQKKMNLTEQAGLRLITIFEDEWLTKRAIVESMLTNILAKNSTKIDARKCEVKSISSRDGMDFIRENHIQGRGRANVYYGLYLNRELVSVMSFSNNELSRKSTGWDINRFCSKLGTNVRGGAGKLFNRFCYDHSPNQVISYADLRWGTGNVYGHLGFELVGRTLPNYWYFHNGEMRRYHRYGLRKNEADDPLLTEWENRQQQGWNRIWDCGHAKWVWTNKKPRN